MSGLTRRRSITAPSGELPLLTSRLLLRDFVRTDLPAVERLAAHPRVREHAPLESRALLVARQATATQATPSQRAVRKSYELAIINRRSHKLIGACDIARVGRTRADLGYMLLPRHWGFGYGTEVAKAMVQFGFETMKLTEITAIVATDNEGSRRVLMKAGFVWQGLVRRAIRVGARHWDCHQYTIDRARWLKHATPLKLKKR